MTKKKLSGLSVLVTGGAGFIGSHLVDRLVQELPSNLVVVDNLFLGRESNLDPARRALPGLKFYRADASDYESLKRILRKEEVNVVFNLAVVPLPTSLERPRWTIDMNSAIVTVVCELLREELFQTLIHFSSSEAYGTAQYEPMDEKHPLAPCTPYAASKAAGDFVALSYRETFGVDVAILRPFNNYGPRQNDASYAGIIPIVIRRALTGQPMVIFGDGEQTRDFTFMRDTAEAAVQVYGHTETRGRVINVATGKELSVTRLVRRILHVMGVEVPVIYGDPRPGDVRRHCGASVLLRELTGFEPRPMTDEMIAETVGWYRGEPL